MIRPRHRKANLAARAWALMFDFLMSTSSVRARALDRRGLTPNDARGLWSLDPQNGRPIGSLAHDWGCDPANATYIIGRLERAGLATRRAGDDDRRVKLVTLTPKGAALKRALLREYRKPPAAFRVLPSADLRVVLEIVAKLGPGQRPVRTRRVGRARRGRSARPR
jgi:DNA-binding MarR family transcriptional regulator